jgi:hypothetical protein
MSDIVVAKKRPDLAPDALEVAVFGRLDRIFTLSLSADEQKAWLEVEGAGEKVLIDYSIPKVIDVVVAQIQEQRAKAAEKSGTSGDAS